MQRTAWVPCSMRRDIGHEPVNRFKWLAREYYAEVLPYILYRIRMKRRARLALPVLLAGLLSGVDVPDYSKAPADAALEHRF